MGLISDDKWEEDKEDIKEDVEDFPENAARWTGEKVSLIHVPSSCLFCVFDMILMIVCLGR